MRYSSLHRRGREVSRCFNSNRIQRERFAGNSMSPWVLILSLLWSFQSSPNQHCNDLQLYGRTTKGNFEKCLWTNFHLIFGFSKKGPDWWVPPPSLNSNILKFWILFTRKWRYWREISLNILTKGQYFSILFFTSQLEKTVCNYLCLFQCSKTI